MDALKHFATPCLKENPPAFSIGDTVGVERVFPLHSPVVESVTVIREGKVRRSKLYYLRDRVGKAARVKEAGK